MTRCYTNPHLPLPYLYLLLLVQSYQNKFWQAVAWLELHRTLPLPFLNGKFCWFGSYCLEHFAIDPACIDHYARTVSEWSKDNAVSFGLRDMIRRFRDCLGR